MKLPFSFLAGSRPAKDPYAVLGLSPGASLQEVEDAYLHLWRYWNPESNPLPGAAVRHRAVLRAGKELLAAPKPVPSGSPSWHAVSLRGTSDLRNYQVAASMVIVYATTDGAHAGFDEQAARGPGAGQIPVSLGDESVGWTELAPSFPGLKIVRLTFRIGSLLAQVVLLGPAGSQVQEDALGLSVIQV